MKKLKWSAIITMIVSLLISIVSGYCTVVGMGKVFASAAGVIMFIASVIELGRVVLLYDIHHFWDRLKLYQKIPGILMLLIAMTLSALGVFGFMSNAHSQRTQDVIPIEMEIRQKESEIKILNDAILVNNQQLEQFDGKAFDKYTEMGYVTKAVNLQKEQQKVTNKLYDDNREKQQQITKLNQEILSLQLSAEQKAPTLAHLKYYAKLFNVDNDTAIIIFIVMIMTVFDTLAMYLMITSDWIAKLDYKKEDEIKVEYFKTSDIDENKIVDEIKKVIKDNLNIENVDIQPLDEKLEQCIKLIESKKEQEKIDFTPIFNAIKQDSDYQVESLKKVVNENGKMTVNKLNEEFIKLKNNLKDDTLIDKLDKIESKVKQIQSENSTDIIKETLGSMLDELNSQKNVKLKTIKNSKNNIENKLEKLVELIDDNDDILLSQSFKKYIMDYPKIIDLLKLHYDGNNDILNKLNNI